MGIILRTDTESFINNLQARNNQYRQVNTVNHVYAKSEPDEEKEIKLYRYFSQDTYYNNKSYAKILQKKKQF